MNSNVEREQDMHHEWVVAVVGQHVDVAADTHKMMFSFMHCALCDDGRSY